MATAIFSFGEPVKRFVKEWWFVLVLLMGHVILLNVVVLNRFWQYEAFYMDHGFFDASIWKVSHGLMPLVDQTRDSLVNQLGDHFSPAMYLLSPIYWVTDSYEPLLILENFFITGALFFLFLCAKKLIKGKLMVFGLIFAGSLFLGLQNAAIANYHNVLPAMLTLAISLYAIIEKKWRLFWVAMIITLGLKENFAVLGIGMGIYLAFLKKFRTAGLLVFLSLIIYFGYTLFLAPQINGYPYQYGTGAPPPSRLVTGWLDSPLKTQNLMVSFVTFGFLPILSGGFLPAILQDWLTRFVLNAGQARWDLGLHYNAVLTVLLVFGAILGVAFLERKFPLYKKWGWVHAVFIILATLFFHRTLHGPLALAYNPAFLPHTIEMRFLDPLVEKARACPGLVMAPNNLAAHLTHRPKLMLLRENYEEYRPDCVVIDRRPGQNPNNYWPVTPFNYPAMVEKIATDSAYHKIAITQEQLIFRRRP